MPSLVTCTGPRPPCYPFGSPPNPTLANGTVVWLDQIVPGKLVRGVVRGDSADCYLVDLGARLSDRHPYQVISALYTLIVWPEHAPDAAAWGLAAPALPPVDESGIPIRPGDSASWARTSGLPK